LNPALDLPIGRFPWAFPSRTLYAYNSVLNRATCSAHQNHLATNTLTINSSWLRCCRPVPDTFHIWSDHLLILCSIFFLIRRYWKTCLRLVLCKCYVKVPLCPRILLFTFNILKFVEFLMSEYPATLIYADCIGYLVFSWNNPVSLPGMTEGLNIRIVHSYTVGKLVNILIIHLNAT
jgi:hypothetical protein